MSYDINFAHGKPFKIKLDLTISEASHFGYYIFEIVTSQQNITTTRFHISALDNYLLTLYVAFTGNELIRAKHTHTIITQLY